MPLTHLQRLEAESIHIMREVVAEADNPVMLYSIGKDSAVMLHLAMKAFYRSEEHTSELQSLMRISYAVFCLKKKKQQNKTQPTHTDKQSHHYRHNCIQITT